LLILVASLATWVNRSPIGNRLVNLVVAWFFAPISRPKRVSVCRDAGRTWPRTIETARQIALQIRRDSQAPRKLAGQVSSADGRRLAGIPRDRSIRETSSPVRPEGSSPGAWSNESQYTAV